MARPLLERRLIDIAERIKRLRADAAVAAEQVAHLEDEARDFELRALVSETPMAGVEARQARRHADAQAAQRDSLLRSITDLEREQDALLDRMAAELTDGS